jgi:hypothetical protein
VKFRHGIKAHHRYKDDIIILASRLGDYQAYIFHLMRVSSYYKIKVEEVLCEVGDVADFLQLHIRLLETGYEAFL